MTINKNSTEQINVALLDLESKIKRSNQSSAISRLESNIDAINKALNTKQNGLAPGATYDINISGNAATSNHSLTADNATTADSANTATTAGYANNAINADIATVAKGLPFGTCTTAAATVNKEVTVTPSITTLTAGTTIAVKMENTNNASNATLNVNNTGAYLIKRYSNTNAGTSNSEAWQGGVIQLLTFDGSYWYLDDFRQNAQYALTAERTFGAGWCNTDAATSAKIANLYDFTLQAGSTFTLYFNIANTAASALTLNMNSTGAEPIYINGVASSATNYTIPKGTYFVTYNGTYYNVQTNGPHAITADYATTAGAAAIAFPVGFVYQQPYRTPSPAQMNMQVPADCAWVDISNEYSGDYFRVKNPRWHPSQPTVNVKVTAYNSSTKVVTIESGVVVEGQVWSRDIVRNNRTGELAWTTGRTSETIDGVTYNKTFTLDRDINITVGQYISFSHGDAIQQHCHSGTTSWVNNHTHTSNVWNALGSGATTGSNLYSMVAAANNRGGRVLSGGSSGAGGHSHTMTTGNAATIGTEYLINVREDTRVQCSFMTVWQVQQI